MWLAAALALAGPVAVAPEHAEIAFVHGGQIWSSRADGSERRLLVAPTPEKSLETPAWSPDGSKLAYVSEVERRFVEDHTAQLMLLDAAGSRAVTPLRQGVEDFSPAWSPDGTALVFSRIIESGRDPRSEIVIRELSRGQERVLVSLPPDEDRSTVLEPTWSPDGGTIAYTQIGFGRAFTWRPVIRTIAAAGGASRVLIPDASSPAWSSDGSRLAFAGERDRNGYRCVDIDICSYAAELYVAAADGTGLTRLTNGEGDEFDPKWSPDGSRILFTSDRNFPEGDSREVYSIAPDGSCLTWLTNGNPASGIATWRPGSGVRYDPGSCDPDLRGALWEGPAPPRFRGGLWLGTGYRGLLLSDVERWPGHVELTYDDCEKFEPRDCPRRIVVTGASACARSAFSGLIHNRYRFARRRGAVVALPSGPARLRVMSGDAITTIRLARSALVSQVIRDIRPFAASGPARRLPPPRVSRSFARRLESTTERRGRRLRELLRPYRFSSCG